MLIMTMFDSQASLTPFHPCPVFSFLLLYPKLFSTPLFSSPSPLLSPLQLFYVILSSPLSPTFLHSTHLLLSFLLLSFSPPLLSSPHIFSPLPSSPPIFSSLLFSSPLIFSTLLSSPPIFSSLLLSSPPIFTPLLSSHHITSHHINTLFISFRLVSSYL